MKVCSGVEVEGKLVLGFSVAGLEYADASRYWVYGKLQVVMAGAGKGNAPWKSVLAAGPCSVSPVELIVPNWREVWDMDWDSFQLHGQVVLLDALNGYRSQKHRLSALVELK